MSRAIKWSVVFKMRAGKTIKIIPGSCDEIKLAMVKLGSLDLVQRALKMAGSVHSNVGHVLLLKMKFIF